MSNHIDQLTAFIESLNQIGNLDELTAHHVSPRDIRRWTRTVEQNANAALELASDLAKEIGDSDDELIPIVRSMRRNALVSRRCAHSLAAAVTTADYDRYAICVRDSYRALVESCSRSVNQFAPGMHLAVTSAIGGY